METEQDRSEQVAKMNNKCQTLDVPDRNDSLLQEGKEYYLPNFANLQNFVKEAASQGIHRTIPQDYRQSQQQWANQWNMLGSYLFVENSTLQTIGDKYGSVSRENVRKVIQRAAKKLYDFSPPELQEAYSFGNFSFQKKTPRERRFKYSEMRGGKLRQVEQMAEEGKSAQEMMDTLGISRDQLNHLRAKHKDLHIPYFPSTRKIYDQLADPTTAREKRQELLNTIVSRVNYTNIHVVKLSTITKEAGLQMMGKGNRVFRVVDVLRLHGIPINVIEEKVEKSTYRYGIIAEVDQERALEVLKADTSLDDLRRQK